jgi:hypothetical protein
MLYRCTPRFQCNDPLALVPFRDLSISAQFGTGYNPVGARIKDYLTLPPGIVR